MVDIFEEIDIMRAPIVLRNLEEQLTKELCEITKKQVDPYEEYADAVETEDNDYAEMLDYYDVQRLLGEVGYTICEMERNGKLALTDRVEPDTGAGCKLTTRECQKMGGRPIGSFHTHPVGGNTPSIADIECSLRNELFFCIGGFGGDKHEVTCYTPWPRIREHGIMYNPLSNNPYYPRASVEPDGKINFWRETPPPTAQDLLEDEIYKYWSDKPEEQEEFRKMLEEGEIPDEAWENYESEGERDSLDIYTPEKLKVVEAERKEFLKRDFDVMEVECGGRVDGVSGSRYTGVVLPDKTHAADLDSNYLYHWAPTANVDSILKSGLTPRFDPHMEASDLPAVVVNLCEKDKCDRWKGMIEGSVFGTSDMTLLKVKVDKNKLRLINRDYGWFVSDEKISPENIGVVNK